jgi:hypothetical protein
VKFEGFARKPDRQRKRKPKKPFQDEQKPVEPDQNTGDAVTTHDQDIPEKKKKFQLQNWKQSTWKGRIPQGSMQKRFSYAGAVEVSKRYRKINIRSAVRAASPELSGDDELYSFQNRMQVEDYEPNEKQIELVSKQLKRYAVSATAPQLDANLPVNLTDFPESRIQCQPQLPLPDSEGHYPGDLSKVEILQKEIIRLDALNRALMAVHQNDRMLVPTVKAFIKAETDLSDSQKKNRVEDGRILIDALCKNTVDRENLLADSESIILAVRRRDNAVRKNKTGIELAQAVSADMLKDSDIKESATLWEECEQKEQKN